MRRIYIILIVLFCTFLYAINGNKIVYAENSNIDYESVSKELEKEIEKNHIPGMSVIVVNPEEVLFSKTYIKSA